jgi:hypothetical protein
MSRVRKSIRLLLATAIATAVALGSAAAFALRNSEAPATVVEPVTAPAVALTETEEPTTNAWALGLAAAAVMLWSAQRRRRADQA